MPSDEFEGWTRLPNGAWTRDEPATARIAWWCAECEEWHPVGTAYGTATLVTREDPRPAHLQYEDN